MRRSKLGALAWITLFTLSCGARAGAPLDPPAPREAIAPVDAPAAVAEAPAPAAPAPRDPRPARVADYLANARTGLTRGEVELLAQTIVQEADRNGIDPRLVLALMYVESRYHNFAVSPVGAMGLMQILPSTGEELAQRLGIEWTGPQTLFDPIANVRMGVAYVKELSDRYDGSLRTALAAYNWGPGHIDRRLDRGVPLPRVYPGLVMQAYGAASANPQS